MDSISIPENLADLAAQMEDAVRKVESAVNARKDASIHYSNHFNRKFAVLLGFLMNLRMVIGRLHSQAEERKVSELSYERSAENTLDLKSIYIFSKIFFDQYVELLDFVLQLERRGVVVKSKRGHYTISTLHFSLRDYIGNDPLVKDFVAQTYDKLHSLYVYVVEYRDTHIMHPGLDTWSDTWTLSNPDGSTRFLTQRPSSTPLEIAFIDRNFLRDTTEFICEKLDTILAEWVLPESDPYPVVVAK